MVMCLTLNAQNDTTIVNSHIEFTKEDFVSKSGETKTYYYAQYNGKTFTSNKSSYDRAKLYRRFRKEYVCVLITNKKSKRIVIL